MVQRRIVMLGASPSTRCLLKTLAGLHSEKKAKDEEFQSNPD